MHTIKNTLKYIINNNYNKIIKTMKYMESNSSIRKFINR